jgi:cell division septum initiation protein DivIVA
VLATIDEAAFDLAFRGYRPDQVHSTLDQIRFEVAEMSTAYGQARREAESLRIRLERPADPPPPPPAARPSPAAPVSRRVAALLEEAQQLVTDQLRAATERTEGIVDAAEHLAEELTADAQREAATIVEAARRTAAETTACAEARAAEAAAVEQQLNSRLQAAFDAVSALRATVVEDREHEVVAADALPAHAAAHALAPPVGDGAAARKVLGGRP